MVPDSSGGSLKRFRYRAYPTGRQVQAAARLFGCCRAAYNDAAAFGQAAHSQGRRVCRADVPANLTASKTTPERAYRSFFDSRGGSQSILVLLMVPVIIMVAGLVVDGGRKVAAAQRAEAAASSAARAGVDAAGTGQLAGRVDTTAAIRAVNQYLASTPQVTGTAVLLPGGRMRVRTQSSRATLYLSIIGVGTVTGRGDAVATLVETGGTP